MVLSTGELNYPEWSTHFGDRAQINGKLRSITVKRAKAFLTFIVEGDHRMEELAELVCLNVASFTWFGQNKLRPNKQIAEGAGHLPSTNIAICHPSPDSTRSVEIKSWG